MDTNSIQETLEETFNQNRLQLRPVLTLNQYIENVFLPGNCTCFRCLEVGSDAGFSTPHNFLINDVQRHRVFGKTTPGEFKSKLVAAYESAYQCTWEYTQGAHVKVDKIKTLITDANIDGFEALLTFSQIFNRIGDAYINTEHSWQKKKAPALNVSSWLTEHSNTYFADCETTGLKNPEIIEIAIIDNQGETVYTGYFNPKTAIEPGAQVVHGISAEFLADKPSFEACFEELRDVIKSKKLVFFNKEFDIRALKTTCELHAVSFDDLNLTFDCAMVDAAKLLGSPSGSGRISLQNALKYAGLTFEGQAHCAVDDTKATLALAKRLAELAEIKH
jgi:DNA polymerase III epsilon subunit-like protein